jgi:hypothetical protein
MCQPSAILVTIFKTRPVKNLRSFRLLPFSFRLARPSAFFLLPFYFFLLPWRVHEENEPVCERLQNINPRKQLPATLMQAEHVICTGAARIEEAKKYGVFWPSDQRPLHFQDGSPIELRMLRKNDPIHIKNLQYCTGSMWDHYHFDL